MGQTRLRLVSKRILLCILLCKNNVSKKLICLKRHIILCTLYLYIAMRIIQRFLTDKIWKCENIEIKGQSNLFSFSRFGAGEFV